jgi:uncharacterized damage-inducible protein DinB
MEDIRYPIGKFSPKENYTQQERNSFIESIESFPQRLSDEIISLTDAQLDTPYREGGWTVRQVVHHLSDSHMHAYIRTKWTLTEDSPVIKAYLEKAWAETSENTADVAFSLALIKALHAKWAILLKSIPEESLTRYFVHPETKRQVRLDTLMGMYSWHGNHHLAHITGLKARMGW